MNGSPAAPPSLTQVVTHHFALTGVLFSGQTKFENVAIVETAEYGKMLVVGDRTQSTEADEYVYHESLVHPALVAHAAPSRVLVIGGSEGAALREVLRHPSIDRVIMAHADRDLVHQCEQLMPEWHHGAFHDPRVELMFTDPMEFLGPTHGHFDVIVADTRHAGGLGMPLPREAFYRAVKARLASRGLFVADAMELSAFDHGEHVIAHQALRRLFRHVASYAVFMPSFRTSRGFIVASDDTDVSRLTTGDVDTALRDRGLTSLLRHYDGQTHVHMFALPKAIRALLAGKAEWSVWPERASLRRPAASGVSARA